MRKIWFLSAVLAVLLSSHAVLALTVEQRDNTNSDGTTKFVDPDEQTPRGLVSPDAANGERISGPLSSGPSVNGPSVSQMIGVNQGNGAFNRGYAPLQNQNK